MQRRITVFLKAAIAGGAAGDLFAAPVVVQGYQRGAAYVAPHAATRHKRAAPPPRRFHGKPTHWEGVDFIDEAHAELAKHGFGLMQGQSGDPATRRALFHHFHGFAEHDPGGDRPFSSEAHVDDLAREYAEEVLDGAGGGSVISPDAEGLYWRRAALHAHG